MNEDPRESRAAAVPHMDTRQSSIATRLLVGLLALFGGLLVVAAGWIAGIGVALGLLGVGLAVAAIGVSSISARTRRVHEAKSSAELTVLSERLLRLESRPAAAPPPDDGQGQDLAADVALLGRLVSGLAETVAAQDEALGAIKRERSGPAAMEAAAAPRPAAATEPPAVAPEPASASPRPAPRAPATMPPLDTRDDFARTASAILERLSHGRASPGFRASRPPPAAEPQPDGRASRPPVGMPASSLDERPVLEAVAAGAFEFLLQPIVTLPQRRTRLYDIQPRLAVGDRRLEAAAVLPILERHRCRSHLDLALVDQAGRIAQHLAARDSAAAVVAPLDAASLLDPEVLARLARLVAPAPETAKRLVVAIGQAAFRSLMLNPDGQAGALRAAGVRFLLDPVDRLRADWGEMAEWGVDFVRIPAGTILDPDRRTAMRDLREALWAAGLELVASGVDEEGYVPELLDDEVSLGIGRTLAPPRPVRADPSEPRPSAEVGLADTPAQGRFETVPYRKVLRQAG